MSGIDKSFVGQTSEHASANLLQRYENRNANNSICQKKVYPIVIEVILARVKCLLESGE